MFQIVVDSAANIPAELVKKYQIQVLSFVNYVDGKELVCFDPSLSPEEEREKGKKYYVRVRLGVTRDGKKIYGKWGKIKKKKIKK